MVGWLTSANDWFSLHLKVGGLVLGCEEPVCHYVFAIDTPELCWVLRGPVVCDKHSNEQQF